VNRRCGRRERGESRSRTPRTQLRTSSPRPGRRSSWYQAYAADAGRAPTSGLMTSSAGTASPTLAADLVPRQPCSRGARESRLSPRQLLLVQSWTGTLPGVCREVIPEVLRRSWTLLRRTEVEHGNAGSVLMSPSCPILPPRCAGTPPSLGDGSPHGRRVKPICCERGPQTAAGGVSAVSGIPMVPGRQSGVLAFV